MADDPTRAELARLRVELIAQRAVTTRLRADLAHLRRRRFPRRLVPLALVALFVTLAPVTSLAALFVDLNSGSPHNANIIAIADAGITKGCNPPLNDQYCPNDLVTRQEMASFLARLGGLGSNPPVANAAQLGGQPASAYLRAGQDAAVGNLAATGTITSPQFHATTVLFKPGPLPLSATFTSHGGTLLVFTSGSGFRLSTRGNIGLLIVIDDQGFGSTTYSNEILSHKTFPSTAFIFSVPAGTHTLTLGGYNDDADNAATATNEADIFTATVLELPFSTTP